MLFGGGQGMVLTAALEELEQRNKRLEMECNRLRVEAVRFLGVAWEGAGPSCGANEAGRGGTLARRGRRMS